MAKISDLVRRQDSKINVWTTMLCVVLPRLGERHTLEDFCGAAAVKIVTLVSLSMVLSVRLWFHFLTC